MRERGVRHGQDDRVGRAQRVARDEADAVLHRRRILVGARVVHLDVEAVILELANDVDDARIAHIGDILLEGEPQDRHHRAACADAAPDQGLHGLPGNVRTHCVVDAPARKDDFRLVADHRRLVRQVVGVDADAVSADEAGREGQEVPLGAGRGEHVPGIDTHAVEDEGKLVHQRDVEVALGVLDHLGRFRHPDGRGPVDAGRNHGLVDAGDDVERRLVLRGHDLRDPGEGVLPISGVDPLRRVADREVRSAREPRRLLQHRDALLLRHPGVDRRLEHDDVARIETPACRARRAEERPQVRLPGAIDGRGSRHDVEVRFAQLLGIVREAHIGRGELGRVDLAGTIDVPPQLLDAARVDIEADDTRSLPERDRDR